MSSIIIKLFLIMRYFFSSSNAIGLGVLIFIVNKPCAANHAFRAGELWKEYKNRFKEDGYLYSLMHTLLVVSLDTGMHVMPILEDALMTLLSLSFKETVCLFIKATSTFISHCFRMFTEYLSYFVILNTLLFLRHLLVLLCHSRRLILCISLKTAF